MDRPSKGIMDAGGYLILFLIGAGLLFWGLWQVRSGVKDLDRIQRELGEQAEYLQSEISKVKKELRQIQDDNE